MCVFRTFWVVNFSSTRANKRWYESYKRDLIKKSIYNKMIFECFKFSQTTEDLQSVIINKES